MLVLLFLLGALFVLLVALYLDFRWRNRHIIATASRLPCPPALPVIGNALFFLGSINTITKNIIKLTTQFKGLFCIWVGPVPLFVVSYPEDVQIVLNRSNTLEKDDIYSFLKPFLGNGILTGPVPIWKKYRRLINPVLRPANVERSLPVFNDVSRSLVEHLNVQGQAIDPREGIFSLSLDLQGGGLFTNRLFKVHLQIDWLFNYLYRKEIHECHKILDEKLQIIYKEMTDEGNLRRSTSEADQREPQRLGIKTLADVRHDNPEDTEEHEWKDEVTTMIVAATDTLISATSFLMVTLANHLEIQDKVIKEIQDVMGDYDRDVTLSDINALTYLGQAIMESMRIHGVFPVILRKATKNTELSTSTLPAGSRIMLPLHAMGWDKEQFPEPEKFIPERFSADSQIDGETKTHKYAFLPFSAGPRNCIGKFYAMVIMTTMMVHVLRQYSLRSQMRMEDIEYELKIIMFSKNPVLLQFLSR